MALAACGLLLAQVVQATETIETTETTMEKTFGLNVSDIYAKDIKDGVYGLIAGGDGGGSFQVEVWDLRTDQFLYGFVSSNNTNGSYQNESIVITDDNSYRYNWSCYQDFCAVGSISTTVTNDLDVFRIKTTQILRSDASVDGGLWEVSGQTIDVNVVIKIKDANFSDITALKIPGMSKTLDLSSFGQDFYIKGINFTIRPAATNASLDAASIAYTDSYSTNIEITEDLTDDKISGKYSIAVPRAINSDILATLPNEFKTYNADTNPTGRLAASHGANLAIYPQNKVFYVAYYGSGLSERFSSVISNVESEGEFFKAKVSDVEQTFELYKVTTTTSDRVLIKNLGEEGPFPVAQPGGGLYIKKPELNDLNHKMRNKSALDDGDKFLVAWHRGFWRDYPENTLEAIDAAKKKLATSDMLELDVSRAKDLNSENIYNYVLYHDTFMFRESSTGPTDPCIDPYDNILVESKYLSSKPTVKAELKAILTDRFPGYTDTEYDNWLKTASNYTLAELTSMYVRDRFGCLTPITIPTLDDAINRANSNSLPIMVDKGWDDIDCIYWHALLLNYEDNMFFKGGDNRDAEKLTKMFGTELFQQLVYTPFYFDNAAQNSSAVDSDGNLTFFYNFIKKERSKGWIVPGFELQIKRKIEDGSSVEDGYFPDGVKRLLAFNSQYNQSKWMGITQINPTAYNGFDNKIIFMDQGPTPIKSNAYSSRHDRRADLMYNMNYIKCDYWTCDRPDAVIVFLKAIGVMN